MSSLISRFVSRVFFGALGGLFVFGVLLILGMGESRTGIETSASPVFALLGAIVLGFFANKFAPPVDFADSKWIRRAATAVPWIAFLAAGSLAVWRLSGGEYLGQTGDGFHRDFQRYWEAAAVIFGCFLAGLLIRWEAIPGIEWITRAR